MAGRADKGLIITTAVFTNEAIKEAQRPGTTPIDLIDGTELSEKLCDLKLGVRIKVKTIKEFEIDTEWFNHI